MKRYVIQVVIEEGCDEFWEEIKGTGCDEVLDSVRNALSGAGFYDSETETEIRLTKFEDVGE
jgi:hypothetical protein